MVHLTVTGKNHNSIQFFLSGVVIAFSCLGITVLSRRVETPWLCEIKPVLGFLVLQGIALAAYILALRWLVTKRIQVSIMGVVVFAVVFRLVALVGEPLFDDDIYRYVWDGKVTAAGINPYKYAPAEVTLPPFDALGDSTKTEMMEDLDRLNELWYEKRDETSLFGRINYPEVRTIYPPVAQGVFALAYLVTPMPLLAITTFKFVLTCFDVLAIFFIIAALRKLELNPCLSMVYAWHPMVIKEIAGTGHMEAIPVFFIAAGVYLLVWSKHVLSAGAFAFGLCAKLVPALALPFVGVELVKRGFTRLLLGGLIVLGITVLCYLPFLDAGKLMFSGTGAFAGKWEMNAGPFELLRWLTEVLLPGGLESNASLVARIMVVVLLLAMVVFTLFRGADTKRKRVGQVFIVLMAVYLLSPVQNPWYLCWSLPLLCFNFRWSWVLLSVCSVFYYVYFALAMNPTDTGFDIVGPAILVIQYAPFALLFVLENKVKSSKTDDIYRKK